MYTQKGVRSNLRAIMVLDHSRSGANAGFFLGGVTDDVKKFKSEYEEEGF